MPFFTSIPYTSDQLMSTFRGSLHGGFNRQLGCVAKNASLYALLTFSFIFISSVYAKIYYISELHLPFIKSKQLSYILRYSRFVSFVLFANCITRNGYRKKI